MRVYLLATLLFFFSCDHLTDRSRESDVSPVQPAPNASQTPFTFPVLTKEDLGRLDERLPKRSREILEKADVLDLFETAVCLGGYELTPIEKDKFQGCDIRKQAKVKDPSQKKQLLDGIYYAIGSSGSGAACSSPRHGIRAEYNRKRIELLICFQCENFRGASNFGSVGGGFSRAPQELFEKILTDYLDHND